MWRSLFACLLCLLFLPGCGDNGVWPTFAGRNDYSIDLPAGWTSCNDDPLSLFMAACMADQHRVVEHLLLADDGDRKMIVVIASNRGGMRSPKAIQDEYQRFSRRQLVNRPEALMRFIDSRGPFFQEEVRHGGTVSFSRRIYTRKGYVEVQAGVIPDTPEALARVDAVVKGIHVSPHAAYRCPPNGAVK